MKTLQVIIILSIVLNLSPLPAQNPAGNALFLDGDSDYVEVLDSESLDLTGEMTIEAWVNPTAFDTINRIVTKWKTEAVGQGSWIFSIRNNALLSFNVSGNGSNSGSGAISSTPVPANVNSHVAGVYNVSENIIRIYINGQLTSEQIGEGNIFVSNSKVLIGAMVYYLGQTFFEGQIDEVRIWNRIRSVQQLQSTMNDTLGPEYYSSADSGIVGYWRFDELEDLGVNGDGGDDVRDFSVYANHGDLAGDVFLDVSGALVAIDTRTPAIADDFALYQNYPNPFNPTTKISYSIPSRNLVRLVVYDILGREVNTLVNSIKSSGVYEIDFDAGELSSGIYVYRLQAGGFNRVKKMLLIR